VETHAARETAHRTVAGRGGVRWRRARHARGSARHRRIARDARTRAHVEPRVALQSARRAVARCGGIRGGHARCAARSASHRVGVPEASGSAEMEARVARHAAPHAVTCGARARRRGTRITRSAAGGDRRVRHARPEAVVRSRHARNVAHVDVSGDVGHSVCQGLPVRACIPGGVRPSERSEVNSAAGGNGERDRENEPRRRSQAKARHARIVAANDACWPVRGRSCGRRSHMECRCRSLARVATVVGDFEFPAR